jgi:pyridoxamine 5'-phosphate oxidase family protein
MCAHAAALLERSGLAPELADASGDPDDRRTVTDAAHRAPHRGSLLMSRFTEHELDFLRTRPGLGRIATVDADGDPHVVPTGWSYNLEHDTIDVGGITLELPPFRPRAVIVKGRAETLDDPALIRIHPERIISWGLDSTEFGERSSRSVTAGEAQ